MPYGMLPVLEIDGKPIAQSNAVARYLAREHNLAGKDEWESMLCDVLVDTLGDLKQCKWYYNDFPISETENTACTYDAFFFLIISGSFSCISIANNPYFSFW